MRVSCVSVLFRRLFSHLQQCQQEDNSGGQVGQFVNGIQNAYLYMRDNGDILTWTVNPDLIAMPPSAR